MQPSLYTAWHALSSSHYNPTAASSSSQTASLSAYLAEGAASLLLPLCQQELKQQHKESLRLGYQSLRPTRRNAKLDAKGKKKKTGLSALLRNEEGVATAGGEGDAELSTPAPGDENVASAVADKGKKKRKRTRKFSKVVVDWDQPSGSGLDQEDYQDEEVAEEDEMRRRIRVPPVDVPDDFPSGDLLLSILTRSTEVYSASSLLLPRLTPSNPRISPTLTSTLIDPLIASLTSQESTIASQPPTDATKAAFKSVLQGWSAHTPKEKEKDPDCAWNGVWRDLERRFEGSALVALGVLVDTLCRWELGEYEDEDGGAGGAEIGQEWERRTDRGPTQEEEQEDLPNLEEMLRRSRDSKRMREAGETDEEVIRVERERSKRRRADEQVS